MYLVHSAVTDAGRRREQNEDHFLAAPSAGMFAVIDGSGPWTASEVKRALAERVLAGDDAIEAVRAANVRVVERSIQDEPRPAGAGAALTVLQLSAGRALVAHVGDTRCYHLLPHRGLVQITRDHTLVAEQLERGIVTPAQAETSPFAHVITRVIGFGLDVRVDESRVDYAAGDLFLLCSDGLWREVPEVEIASVLSRAPIEEAAAQLVAQANARGASDNLTAVVIAVRG